jgi:SAM-dependent methyltransferase
MQAPNYSETADIETSSEDYARRFAGEVGEYFLKTQLNILLSLLEPSKNPTILDVGGGHAQLAIPLVKLGYHVTVTGSNDSCQKRLSQALPEGSFTYQTCDMLHLPYANNSFDIVLSFRLIPHVKNWQSLIAELSRVSARTVIVDYPDLRSVNILNFLFFRLKKLLEGNTRPFGLFRRAQIEREFVRNGMGSPVFIPEFFFPMVLHRKLGSALISANLENICKQSGLTSLLGSPIILRIDKNG